MKEFPVGMVALHVAVIGLCKQKFCFYARLNKQTLAVLNEKYFSIKNIHQTINEYYIV